MLGCFIAGAGVRSGSLLLLMWSVKILQILIQVERRGVNACKNDTAASDFFGDNQRCHELSEFAEKVVEYAG